MKRFKILSLLLSLVGMVFVSSCMKDEEEPDYAALIIGTWKSDKPFYDDKPDSYNYKKYTAKAVTPKGLDEEHKEGKDWTIGETTESSAGIEFYYRIEGKQLYEQFPTGVSGGSQYTPMTYTIKSITSTKLVYVDNYDDEHSFTKQ